MKAVFIAEKPSVAAEFAKALKAKRQLGETDTWKVKMP